MNPVLYFSCCRKVGGKSHLTVRSYAMFLYCVSVFNLFQGRLPLSAGAGMQMTQWRLLPREAHCSSGPSQDRTVAWLCTEKPIASCLISVYSDGIPRKRGKLSLVILMEVYQFFNQVRILLVRSLKFYFSQHI